MPLSNGPRGREMREEPARHRTGRTGEVSRWVTPLQPAAVRRTARRLAHTQHARHDAVPSRGRAHRKPRHQETRSPVSALLSAATSTSSWTRRSGRDASASPSAVPKARSPSQKTPPGYRVARRSYQVPSTSMQAALRDLLRRIER